MKYVGLYHLNAYTYADPTWFPDMDPELRAMFAAGDQGRAVGQGRASRRKEDFKINGQYVDTPDKGVVGIPVLRRLRREGVARLSRPERHKSREPFFMSVNFMKVHQPNMPAPGLHPQVAVQEQVRRLGRSSSTPASAASWTRSARSASTRTRSSSTRPTTAPGRTSIPTPATRRSAAPRAPCARAATASRRSPGCRARSRPARRTTTSSAAST